MRRTFPEFAILLYLVTLKRRPIRDLGEHSLEAPFFAVAARAARTSSVIIAETFSATAEEMNWLIETPSRLAISLICR
jgi:hypothetical protein